MAQIIFTIPDDKIPKVVNTILWLFPKPADFVGTNIQWVKEAIRRWLINEIRNKEEEDTKRAVSIPKDDTLIT